jgi:hypothetical protein
MIPILIGPGRTALAGAVPGNASYFTFQTWIRGLSSSEQLDDIQQATRRVKSLPQYGSAGSRFDMVEQLIELQRRIRLSSCGFICQSHRARSVWVKSTCAAIDHSTSLARRWAAQAQAEGPPGPVASAKPYRFWPS